MIRVFLVDDHEIVRRGIADLFAGQPDLRIVGEAGSVDDALEIIPADGVDVAVLDVRLPDGNGIELCRELRSRMPDLPCLILTSYTDDDALRDAVLAGAAGYVLKRVLGDDLVQAVRAVAAGRTLIDPRDVNRLLNRVAGRESDPLAALTNQERIVLDLIGEGLTNRQIGERMFLSDKTVKNYVSHLLSKLDVQRRAQLAVLAARHHSGSGSAGGSA